MNPTSLTPVGTDLTHAREDTYVACQVTEQREDGSLGVRLSGGITGFIKPVDFQQWIVEG